MFRWALAVLVMAAVCHAILLQSPEHGSSVQTNMPITVAGMNLQPGSLYSFYFYLQKNGDEVLVHSMLNQPSAVYVYTIPTEIDEFPYWFSAGNSLRVLLEEYFPPLNETTGASVTLLADPINTLTVRTLPADITVTLDGVPVGDGKKIHIAGTWTFTAVAPDIVCENGYQYHFEGWRDKSHNLIVSAPTAPLTLMETTTWTVSYTRTINPCTGFIDMGCMIPGFPFLVLEYGSPADNHQCALHCSNQGFAVSLTQSSVCACAHTITAELPEINVVVPCTKGCDGDLGGSSTCGGDELGSFQVSVSQYPEPLENFEVIGCYATTPMVPFTTVGIVNIDPSLMSASLCSARCYAHEFFGIVDGRNCYCASNPFINGPSMGCNVQCPGTQQCGGADVVTIFANCDVASDWCSGTSSYSRLLHSVTSKLGVSAAFLGICLAGTVVLLAATIVIHRYRQKQATTFSN